MLLSKESKCVFAIFLTIDTCLTFENCTEFYENAIAIARKVAAKLRNLAKMEGGGNSIVS